MVRILCNDSGTKASANGATEAVAIIDPKASVEVLMVYKVNRNVFQGNDKVRDEQLMYIT